MSNIDDIAIKYGGKSTSAIAGKYGGNIVKEVQSNLLGDPLSDYNADVETGADTATRIGASFKMTPEGKIGYLQNKFGKTNVSIRADGEIFYKNPKTSKWTQFDEKNASLKDIADFSGDAPAAVLGVAGDLATGGNPLGAAGGAGLGNVIKQAVSKTLPGDDNMTPLQRGGSVALDTLLGGATQLGANQLTKVIDKARPSNIIAGSVKKSLESDYANQGRQLSADTGIDLSTGQISGSRGQIGIEGLGRRNPVSADTFAAFDNKQLSQSVSRLNAVMDKIHSSEVGDIGLGQKITDAFNGTLDKALEIRRGQATKDFGALKAVSQNKPVIPTDNLRTAIQNVIDEFDVPGGGDATASLVSKAKALLAGLEDSPATKEQSVILGNRIIKGQPKQLTAEETNRLLQIYSNAQSGKGTLFGDIDKAQQKLIAGKLKDGLLADMDSAAQGSQGDVASLLKSARDNYRVNSQQINDLGESVLGKYFDNGPRTPERVADYFNKMKPSEINASMGILSKHDPEMASATQRYIIEKALDKAAPSASDQAANGIKFSAAKFLSALPDDKTLTAVFQGSAAKQDLNNVAKVLERVADRAKTEGSPTAPLMMAWDLAKGVFTLNPSAIAGIPTAILAPKAIAKAALTPEGRKALMTVTQTGVPARKMIQAVEYLTAANTDVVNKTSNKEMKLNRDELNFIDKTPL